MLRTSGKVYGQNHNGAGIKIPTLSCEVAMFIVVCYDIPDNRRRTKVSNTLEDFGSRVQKSVFECDITPKHFQELRRRLDKVLKDDDGLRYYILCAECVPRIEVFSGPPVTQTQLYFAV